MSDHPQNHIASAPLVRKTISLPSHIIATGKALAKAQQRPFSNYISWLIQRDQDLTRSEHQETL